jgi:hypothetical protein
LATRPTGSLDEGQNQVEELPPVPHSANLFAVTPIKLSERISYERIAAML